MELMLLILSSLQTLVQNPKLGGGGLKNVDTFFLLGHLIRLVQGGEATAKAAKQFAEQIKAMADSGYQPTTRDFEDMTARLDTALNILETAKAKLQEQEGVSEQAAETIIEKTLPTVDAPAPVETPALAVLDEATVAAQEEQMDEPPAPEPEVESKSSAKRKKVQRDE